MGDGRGRWAWAMRVGDAVGDAVGDSRGDTVGRHGGRGLMGDAVGDAVGSDAWQHGACTGLREGRLGRRRGALSTRRRGALSTVWENEDLASVSKIFAAARAGDVSLMTWQGAS